MVPNPEKRGWGFQLIRGSSDQSVVLEWATMVSRWYALGHVLEIRLLVFDHPYMVGIHNAILGGGFVVPYYLTTKTPRLCGGLRSN